MKVNNEMFCSKPHSPLHRDRQGFLKVRTPELLLFQNIVNKGGYNPVVKPAEKLFT